MIPHNPISCEPTCISSISTCLCVPRGVWDIVIWNVQSMTRSIPEYSEDRDWHDLDIGHHVTRNRTLIRDVHLVNIHWYFYNFIVTTVWPNHDFVLSRYRCRDDRKFAGYERQLRIAWAEYYLHDASVTRPITSSIAPSSAKNDDNNIISTSRSKRTIKRS